MTETYYGCTNLTEAACGPNVEYMAETTYHGCTNLTKAVFGDNVTNIYQTYKNCPNIQGNTYLYSQDIDSAYCCFEGRNTSAMLNIFLPENSASLTECLIANKSSIVGANITWIDDMEVNGRYYNETYNIYLYPVSNVKQTKINNGD